MLWYNGQLREGNALELSVDDPGLLYGATVFTTLRVYQQSLDHPLTNWSRHCDRLHNSLEIFGWKQPNWEQLRQGAEILLTDYPVLRIAIFPDGREWIVGRSLPTDLTQRQQFGVTAWVADAPEFRRFLPTHKTGNYLAAWLALQKAQQEEAKEAILVDAEGNWLETSTGNLWGWKNGCWWTPVGESLPGIGRSQLKKWLERHHHPVKENIWDRHFVQDLEAIAYTNSVVEIIPLCRVIHAYSISNYPANHIALKQLQHFFKDDTTNGL